MASPSIHLEPSLARLHGATPDQIKAVAAALSLPSAENPDETESLFIQSANAFPARLIHRVIDALGHRPSITWRAPYRFDGEWMARNEDIVSSWGLRGSYQREAISQLLRRMGGILHSAAGSGKTVMASRAIEAILTEWNMPTFAVLWIAQTQDQVRQAKAALALIPEPLRKRASFDVRCWQGIDERDPLLATFDILVGDEIHASTDAIYRIAQACTQAWWRIGLTATYVRGDGRELLMEAAFGQVAASISQSRVLAEGHLVRGTVCFVPVETPGLDRLVLDSASPEIARLAWMKDDAKRDERKRQIIYAHATKLGITENKARHEVVSSVARAEIAAGRTVLVLVSTKDQGREIVSRVPGSILVHSGMTKAEGGRVESIKRLASGDLSCMVATSLADQGFDVPRVSTVIMAGGGKGGSKGYLIEQRAARGQRTFEGKDAARIVDFHDLSHPVLRAQSWKRHRKYRDLGFSLLPVEEILAGGAA